MLKHIKRWCINNLKGKDSMYEAQMKAGNNLYVRTVDVDKENGENVCYLIEVAPEV